MGIGFEDIFDGIPPPPARTLDRPLYAVTPVPGHLQYFVGKDSDEQACLLVATSDRAGRLQPPIRLDALDVQFELRCLLKKQGEPEREGAFTVIRCRALERETIRYFLSVCEAVVRMLGDSPTRQQVGAAVNRIAAIFQQMRKPPLRPVTGLFGELYMLWRSSNAARAVTAWRNDDTARFDFSDGDARLDVKATGGRLRIHTFSYEQCNPPASTIAVVASLHVELTTGGTALRSILEAVAERVAAHPHLAMKLHEVVAATLGASLNEALALRFDIRLADSSLRLFSLEAVPALRGPLPAGVSDVHFRSDLSSVAAVAAQSLIEQDSVFADLLARDG